MIVAALRKLLSVRRRHTSANPSPEEFSSKIENGAVPDGYLPFGHALTAWAAFERSVDIAVWLAIGAGPDVGVCVTDQVQSVRAKILIFETIVEKKGASQTDMKALRRFRNDLEGITRERNRLIHDPHMPRGLDMVAMRSTGTTDDRFTEEVISKDSLFDFAKRAHEKNDAWFKLFSAILISVGLGPSSGKFP